MISRNFKVTFISRNIKHNLLCISRQTILVLFSIVGFTAHSQNFVEGLIKDESSNIQLSFSNIYIDSTRVGTIADTTGYFKLNVPDTLTSGVLVVKHLGYSTINMPVDDLVNTKQVIYLNKNNIPLTVFEKDAKRGKKMKRRTAGSKKRKSEGYFYGDYGREYALFIENNREFKGYISKVKFYITEKGKADSPFRIRIYGVNSQSGAPHKELLDESIVVSASVGNEWVVVDVLKHVLKIPKDGFFVSMEWLPAFAYEEPKEALDITTNHYQIPVLGATNEFGMQGLTWTRKHLSSWSVPIVPANSINVINAKIGVELLVKKRNAD